MFPFVSSNSFNVSVVAVILSLLYCPEIDAWSLTSTSKVVGGGGAWLKSSATAPDTRRRTPPTMYRDNVASPTVEIPSEKSATITVARSRSRNNAWFNGGASASAASLKNSPPSSPPLMETNIPSSSFQKGISSNSNMPWKESICPDYNTPENNAGGGLFYMPFWEWQMQFMKSRLTNLRALPVVSRTGVDMSYVQNNNNNNNNVTSITTAPTMRMHTCCFCSDEYKLIRLTVLDAGWKTQVFTSLWYPASSTDPVLGVDLLQFNHAKKHLCIVDFQPVVAKAEATEATATTFESVLKPIRDAYPSLQGKMTDRFYNHADSYFSNQMLLGRDDNNNSEEERYTPQEMVYRDLFPAFQQYVAAHVDMVQTQQQQQQQRDGATTTDMDEVRACHEAYDTYSAARDPAHGLLARCFGQTWADEYVYDILFPSAVRETK